MKRCLYGFKEEDCHHWECECTCQSFEVYDPFCPVHGTNDLEDNRRESGRLPEGE